MSIDVEKAMIRYYFDGACSKIILMIMTRHSIPCTCDMHDDKATVYCADPQYKPNIRYSYLDERASVDLYYFNKLITGANVEIRYKTLEDLVANTQHAVSKLKLLLDMSHKDLLASNKQKEEARA